MLLAGKKVKLSFPDTKSFTNFRSSLYTYKTRYSNNMSKLGYGCGDILEGKSICTDVLEQESADSRTPETPTSLVVLIWAGTKQATPANFKILEVLES